DPDEQRLFELLSVFTGIRVDPLEAIAAEARLGEGGADPLEALASLLDKSLIRQSDAGQEAAGFVMLETIREFATERLADRPERDAARFAHATYFTDFGQRTLADATGEVGEPAVAVLSVEGDNLRTAWRYWLS